MFEYNGNEYTLEELQTSAKNQNLDFETFMKRMTTAGMVEKQTGPTSQSPTVGSKFAFLNNTDYTSDDGSLVFTKHDESGQWAKSVDYGKTQELIDEKYVPEIYRNLHNESTESEKEYSSVGELAANLAVGFVETRKGISSYVEGMQLGLFEMFTPGEMSAEEKKAMLQSIRFLNSATAVGSSKSYDPIIDALEEYIPEYNGTITEDLLEGNYAETTWRTVNAALRSAPSLVAAATGVGGIGVIGISAAGNKFEEEFELDPEASTGALLANASAVGATEAAFELVTRGLMKKAGLTFGAMGGEAAKEVLEAGAKNMVKSIAYGMGTEGLGEASTELAIALIDAAPKEWGIGRGKEINSKELLYRLGDAGLVGSFVGGGITSVGEIGKRGKVAKERAQQILMQEEAKNELTPIISKVNELSDDLLDASPEGKNVINQEIDFLLDKAVKIKIKSSQELGTLQGKNFTEYAKNVDKINNLKNVIKTANNKSELNLANKKLNELTDVNKNIIEKSIIENTKKITESIRNQAAFFEEVSGKKIKVTEASSSDIQGKFDVETTEEVAYYEAEIEGARTQLESGVSAETNVELTVNEVVELEGIINQASEMMDRVTQQGKVASSEHGFIGFNPKTGDVEITVNKDSDMMGTSAHEFLHAVLFHSIKGDSKTQSKLGDQLMDHVSGLKFEASVFNERLTAYGKWTKDSKGEDVFVPDTNFGEETITVMSESILDGSLRFDEGMFSGVGDILRRALTKYTNKDIKWDSGKDVYNFIKDYNHSVANNYVNKKLLTAASKGIKGTLLEGTKEVDVKEGDITQFSKKTHKGNKANFSNKTLNSKSHVKFQNGIKGKKLWRATSKDPNELSKTGEDQHITHFFLGSETDAKKWAVDKEGRTDGEISVFSVKADDVINRVMLDWNDSGYGMDVESMVSMEEMEMSYKELTTNPDNLENRVRKMHEWLRGNPEVSNANKGITEPIGRAYNIKGELVNGLPVAVVGGVKPSLMYFSKVSKKESSLDKKIKKNIQSTKEFAKEVFGDKLTVERFKNNEDAKTFVGELLGDLASSKQLNQFSNALGLHIPHEGLLVINEAQMKVHKKTTTGSHEFLHAVLSLTDSENGLMMASLGYSLFEHLENNFDRNHVEELKSRLSPYYQEGNTKRHTDNAFGKEVFSHLSDMMMEGKFNYNPSDKTSVKAWKKLVNVINKLLVKMGLRVAKFEDGADLYKFVTDFNNMYTSGIIPTSVFSVAHRGVDGEVTLEGYGERSLSNKMADIIEKKEIKAELETLLAKLSDGKEFSNEPKSPQAPTWVEDDFNLKDYFKLDPQYAGDIAVQFSKSIENKSIQELEGMRIELLREKQRVATERKDGWKNLFNSLNERLKVVKNAIAKGGYRATPAVKLTKQQQLEADADALLGLESSEQSEGDYAKQVERHQENIESKTPEIVAKNKELVGRIKMIPKIDQLRSDFKEIVSINKKLGKHENNYSRKLITKEFVEEQRALAAKKINELKAKNNFRDWNYYKNLRHELVMNNVGIVNSVAFREKVKSMDVDSRSKIKVREELLFELGTIVDTYKLSVQATSESGKLLTNESGAPVYVEFGAYANIVIPKRVAGAYEKLNVGNQKGVTHKSEDSMAKIAAGTQDVYDAIDSGNKQADLELSKIMLTDKFNVPVNKISNALDNVTDAGVYIDKQLIPWDQLSYVNLKGIAHDIVNDIIYAERLKQDVKKHRAKEQKRGYKSKGDPRYADAGATKNLGAMLYILQNDATFELFKNSLPKSTVHPVTGKSLKINTKLQALFYKTKVTSKTLESGRIAARSFGSNRSKLTGLKIGEGAGTVYKEKINQNRTQFMAKIGATESVEGLEFIGTSKSDFTQTVPAIAKELERIITNQIVRHAINRGDINPKVANIYYEGDVSANLALGKGELLFSKSGKPKTPLTDIKPKPNEFTANDSQIFNDILERKTGMSATQKLDEATARMIGAKKGKYRFFIPPSAEDFSGLLYNFLPKGQVGDEAMAFFNEKLQRPFNLGTNALNNAKQLAAVRWRDIKKKTNFSQRELGKKLEGTNFSKDNAVRVFLWVEGGMEIPGMDASTANELHNRVSLDPDLSSLAYNILSISANENGQYVSPEKGWLGGSIASDLNGMTDGKGRHQFLEEYINNSEAIFSKDNMMKIEALYGANFKEALEDMLYRMKNGKKRTQGAGRLVGTYLTWVNNSVGATMFFNSRSAVLQLQSTVNYLDFENNSIFTAAKAFANQKQYWEDWAMIFNSPMLQQRRSGLQTDVEAAELADQVRGSKNGVQAAVGYLLKLGFLPTQIADSVAIATGGATYYRNQLKAYKKQGLNNVEAQERAWSDFQEKTQDRQQSSRADMISQQQASLLGRFVLAWQNTPMQMTRLMKKASLDLVNGRGDAKANVSKIIYYGVVQNLIFASLQSAYFAAFFDNEEDEEKKSKTKLKKQERILNSMLDTILRGSGVAGAALSTIKNTILQFQKQEAKGFTKDHAYTIIEGLGFSPTLGSKARKGYGAYKMYDWEKDVINEKGLEYDSPIWDATAQGIEAATNIPTGRIVKKFRNMEGAMNTSNKLYERIPMALGWNPWDLNVDLYPGHEEIKDKAREKRKKEGIEKAKETRKKNKKPKSPFKKFKIKKFN